MQPAWLRFLPKPGNWMITFKMLMGFPMLATALWLLSLAPDHFGEGAVFWVGLFLVLISLAAWLYGRFIQPGQGSPTVAWSVIAAAVLEAIYCLLLKVTYWRTLVSGLVKASGPIAAVFVVDRNPSPYFLLLLFVWILFWEIGGQNVPADWNDTVEDKRVGAKTIPIEFGTQKAGLVVLATLAMTVVMSLFLPLVSHLPLGIPYLIATVIAGYFLLLQPGFQLYKYQDGRLAAKLFDRASYYPMAQLAIVSVFALLVNVIKL